MSVDMAWREWRDTIPWYRPRIAQTQMYDARQTDIPDAELDEAENAGRAALNGARAYAEWAGKRLKWDGRAMTPEERDQLRSGVALAEQKATWIGEFFSRVTLERARREAIRERAALEVRDRERLAELEAATAAGEAA